MTSEEINAQVTRRSVPQAGTVPAIAIGGKGLPVPGGPFRIPGVLTGGQLPAQRVLGCQRRRA